jgi:hypothetical protein
MGPNDPYPAGRSWGAPVAGSDDPGYRANSLIRARPRWVRVFRDGLPVQASLEATGADTSVGRRLFATKRGTNGPRPKPVGSCVGDRARDRRSRTGSCPAQVDVSPSCLAGGVSGHAAALDVAERHGEPVSGGLSSSTSGGQTIRTIDRGDGPPFGEVGREGGAEPHPFDTRRFARSCGTT